MYQIVTTFRFFPLEIVNLHLSFVDFRFDLIWRMAFDIICRQMVLMSWLGTVAVIAALALRLEREYRGFPPGCSQTTEAAFISSWKASEHPSGNGFSPHLVSLPWLNSNGISSLNFHWRVPSCLFLLLLMRPPFVSCRSVSTEVGVIVEIHMKVFSMWALHLHRHRPWNHSPV